MFGALQGRLRPPRSIQHTETVVSARVHACDQPLLDGYGEGQGVLPDPLSDVGATHPWHVNGKICGPGQGS